MKQLLTLLAILSFAKVAAGAVDANSCPISRQDLTEGISATPSSSIKNHELLNRAQISHLLKLTYQLYSSKAQKAPKDAYAELWRGVAADKYFRYLTSPSSHLTNIRPTEATNVYNDADLSLKDALRQLPNSAPANMFCGSFLFWFSNRDPKREARGLDLMWNAVKIEPGSPEAHAVLGDAYAASFRHAYDPKLAKKELDEVIKLNPDDSFPYWDLMMLDIAVSDCRGANEHLTQYVAHLDPSRRSAGFVPGMRAAIQQYLASGR